MRRDRSRRQRRTGRHDRHDGGLTRAVRFRLLGALEAAPGPLSVSELGEAMGVDQPRASRLVQAGQDAGLVRRTVDVRDGRRSVIELTATGRDLLESAREARLAAITAGLSGFTQQEAAQFAALLDRFVRAWPRDLGAG